MPKGYNDKAIAGALMFLEGCFEVVLVEIRQGKPAEEAVKEELAEIRRKLEEDRVE